MIKEIKLPDLGEGIDSAEVSEIKVSKGDSIKSDDTIIVLESDKASMEIPSEVSGKVSKISQMNLFKSNPYSDKSFSMTCIRIWPIMKSTNIINLRNIIS